MTSTRRTLSSRLSFSHAQLEELEEVEVEKPLTLQARRAIIQHKRQNYQAADPRTRRVLLDEITALTGYHRSYARWLLNHPEAAQLRGKRSRPRQYGPEVQHVLFLVWHAANRICPKRLVPYLPLWLEVLERHEHLQISAEARAQILAMSASTAERLLRSQRLRGLRGLSTTRAGSLLRQHIPIRTAQQWNETQPGFLEADLVAHAGPNDEGVYLFTLTLTDVATGWTECVPVCSKSQEVVLEAFRQARCLFPFPILGVDVDCGGEFLNEQMVAYCTHEQIMLTRGRPRMKNDQCFVEAKNRHIVRQVVGHDRYCGDYARRQMWELYRALRLYVNCFQPSMKLLLQEGETSPGPRRYDPAKTPLQRLLLSGVLSPAKEQELLAVVQALDPVRLLQQIEALQQALFHYAVTATPFWHHEVVTPIKTFAWQDCIDSSLPPSLHPAADSFCSEDDGSVEDLLGWKRYRRNPFEGEWAYIASCVRTQPDLTGAGLFRHLQSRTPGRYHPGQLRCLQQGMRQIRSRLLAMRAEPGPRELIHGDLPVPEPASPSLLTSFLLECSTSVQGEVPCCPSEHTSGAPVAPRRGGRRSKAHVSKRVDDTPGPAAISSGEPSAPRDVAPEEPNLPPSATSPLDQAIAAYLQELVDAGYRPKTVQWHQTALGQLRAYLYTHQQSQDLDALTETVVQEWLAALRTTPTVMGMLRSDTTASTYARSARAFGNWLVRTGRRNSPLFSSQPCPSARLKQVQLVEPEAFRQLLKVCELATETGASAEKAAARNRALLWLIWDGGLRVAELCALRRSDVVVQQGLVRIRGAGARARRIAVGPQGQEALHAYLELTYGDDEEPADEEALFQTETGTPLTISALQSLFVRLNQRLNLPGMRVSPSALRDTFAVRYVQAGGSVEALQRVLGLAEPSGIKRYQEAARLFPQEAPALNALITPPT